MIRPYSQMELIGRGGFADVYRARHEHLDRAVAIKVLRVAMTDRSAVAQFRAEATALGQLDRYENVLRVHDANVLPDGRPYLITELCDSSLHQVVANLGPLPAGRVAEIGYQVTRGLLAAHERGIWHGDITPKNVLLRSTGVPVLADFGLAVLRDYGITAAAGGTVPHAAPELLFNDDSVTPAADVYGLGSTLYTALAGRPPFPRRTGEDSRAHAVRILHESVPDLPRTDIPAGLHELVLRMLAEKPGARPQLDDVAEVLADPRLQSRTVGGSGDSAMPTGKRGYGPAAAPEAPSLDPHDMDTRLRGARTPQPPRPARRPWAAVAGAAGGLLVLGAVVAVLLAGRDPNESASGNAGGSAGDRSAGEPATSAPPVSAPAAVTIELVAPVDAGDAVELSWTGPPNLNYGVVVAAEGQPARTVLAKQATTLRVPVDRTGQYCFQVQGSDGRQTYVSNAQAIRGAICRF